MVFQVREFFRNAIAELPDLKSKIGDIEVVLLHDFLISIVELDFWIDELLKRGVDLHSGVEELPIVEGVLR